MNKRTEQALDVVIGYYLPAEPLAGFMMAFVLLALGAMFYCLHKRKGEAYPLYFTGLILCVVPGIILTAIHGHGHLAGTPTPSVVAKECTVLIESVASGEIRWLDRNAVFYVQRACGKREFLVAANSPSSKLALLGQGAYVR